ncbi:MAG: hypothetical protein Q6373_020150 [Candidatus Sigynarchaeota archaeon]
MQIVGGIKRKQVMMAPIDSDQARGIQGTASRSLFKKKDNNSLLP